MKIVFLVLIVFFILQLVYLPLGIGWDESVFVGMGKAIWSFGSEGLYEPIRPVVLPILLGGFSFFGLGFIFMRILMILISAGCLVVFYFIARQYVNRLFSLLGVVLMAFAPVYFLFSSSILTGIFSLFFVLLGFYFFIKEKFVVMSFFLGLAFMTRFPAGLFFLLLFIISWKKNSSKLSSLIAFGGVSLIYPLVALLFGYNPISSFLLAAEHQGNVVFGAPWWFYGLQFLSIPFLFASVIGLYYAIKLRKYELIILALIPLIYFSSIPIKQERFFLLVLPFLLLLSLYGCFHIVRAKKSVGMIVLTFFVLSLTWSGIAIFNSGPFEYEEPSYLSFFEDKKSVVFTTNPLPAAYSSSKFIPLYYSDVQGLLTFIEERGEYALFSRDAFPCDVWGDTCFYNVDVLESHILKGEVVYNEEGYIIAKFQ